MMATQGKKMSRRTIEFEKSTGNVFADLGLPDAEDRLAKAELARKISEILAKRHLSQSDAAALLGVDQPKVSALVRGQLGGCSRERLMRFLNLRGRTVAVVVEVKRAS